MWLYQFIADTKRVIYADATAKTFLTDAFGSHQGLADALVFPVSTQEVRSIPAFNPGNILNPEKVLQRVCIKAV